MGCELGEDENDDGNDVGDSEQTGKYEKSMSAPE